MLKVTPQWNLVTPDPENYFSINIERAEVAHMVDWKIKSYINCLTNKEIQNFINLVSIDGFLTYYETFNLITY